MPGAMTDAPQARPGLKICGITDAATALGAAALGVDFLGLIFAEGSPRRMTVEAASEIAASVGKWRRGRAGGTGPRLVGVFTRQTAGEIAAIGKAVGLDVVQLHGEYGAAAVAELKSAGYEVWRLAPADGAPSDCAGEDAVLLDGRDGKRTGGTGRTADWGRVAALKASGHRVVLAGGLCAGNIRAAAATGADILDVNSGVETAPGVKSLAQIAAVVAALPRRTLL